MMIWDLFALRTCGSFGKFPESLDETFHVDAAYRPRQVLIELIETSNELQQGTYQSDPLGTQTVSNDQIPPKSGTFTGEPVFILIAGLRHEIGSTVGSSQSE